MRFKSKTVDGVQIFAVTGINTVSFAIKASDDAKKGLLGFAVERFDPVEDERYFMYGFKVFREAMPDPDDKLVVTTFDHPVQSFSWDDFTAKSDREYEYKFFPVRGKPKNLDRAAKGPVIKIKTEPLFSKKMHDIFFNRGVASSQAYDRRFQNMSPKELEVKVSAAKKQEALDWLSRDLDEAIIKFIDQTKKGDTLLGCFYEFRYEPVVAALKKAVEREVNLKLIVDAKQNGNPAKGQPPFPRNDNLEMLKTTGLQSLIDAGKCELFPREARSNDIQHNKFLVWLKKGKPVETWTGSTNLSEGGFHGQTNVGHWVRDENTASMFRDYWNLLSRDPGAKEGDPSSLVRQKNKDFREAVDVLANVPATINDINAGVTCVFSPRTSEDILKLYFDLVDKSSTSAYITLAFGINKDLKTLLADNQPDGPLIFMLLEKEDKATTTSATPFVPLTFRNNVYQAWGSFLKEPLYRWTRETNAQKLKLNQHVSYIHSKFLLSDPLGDSPIVVTGSANFSKNSTISNDENMLIIKGDQRVADIYFTEFNRLFNHYYFRSVVSSISAAGTSDPTASLFLESDPDKWLSKYKPGSLKSKKIELYFNMKGITQL